MGGVCVSRKLGSGDEVTIKPCPAIMELGSPSQLP